jgi:hypothetical protein
MTAPDTDNHHGRNEESEALLSGHHREPVADVRSYGSTAAAAPTGSSSAAGHDLPKLRKAVRKLQAIRSVTKDYDFASSSRGAEPGVDVSRTNLAHLKAPLDVSITQWSEHEVEREEFKAADADAFMVWLDDFEPDSQDGKCTWVNVNGRSASTVVRSGDA